MRPCQSAGRLSPFHWRRGSGGSSMAAQPLSTTAATSAAATAGAATAATGATGATSASTSTAATSTSASTGATWMHHLVDGSGLANGSEAPAGVDGPTMPAGYLPLYEDVEAAAEDAGYALIDDISEWLLGTGGGGGGGGPGGAAENSTTLAVTDVAANETLGWLEVLNSTLPSRSNASAEEQPASVVGERGRYALRNFVEQQLGGGGVGAGAAVGGGGDAGIALIDSGEEAALDNVADAETDYGLLGGFGDAELLQRTATAARETLGNRTAPATGSYDGGGSGEVGVAGVAGVAGGLGTAGGAGGGAGGSGGSTFMLLLENFNDYFPNYNGSTVSGTTTIAPGVAATASRSGGLLLEQNLTGLFLDGYRINCTNETLNLTDPCVELRVVDHNYWALILILFPILTLFGNILVILSVCRERSLQTVTNYFIVSLAIADLLVAVVVMPFAVYFL
uniref:Uncharacterized PE-PGRS family protein PE_PGRS46 n=1 Tax=Drosophila rhopaloa TaxID=1041015 RepID=A0A6P4EAZ4_DRORH